MAGAVTTVADGDDSESYTYELIVTDYFLWMDVSVANLALQQEITEGQKIKPSHDIQDRLVIVGSNIK
jgi:hypothetical protein